MAVLSVGRVVQIALREHRAEESKDLAGEVLRPLERGDVAHADKDPQLRAGTALGQIRSVVALAEPIALALSLCPLV
jgi:hypothetical protein